MSIFADVNIRYSHPFKYLNIIKEGKRDGEVEGVLCRGGGSNTLSFDML